MDEEVYSKREDNDAIEEAKYQYIKEEISNITGNMNNIDEDPAYLRDIFLKTESDYVHSLIQDYSMQGLIAEINEYSSDELFKVAQGIVDSVENGEVPEEQMEQVEKKLIVVLAAIKDLIHVRVKTRSR